MSTVAYQPVVHRALVTGASSGIGAAFAERLAREGYDLILVARRRDRLERLAERLQSLYGRTSDVLVADLAQSGDLRAVEERAAHDPTLELLVNNAGFITFNPVAQHDVDLLETMITVHVTALVRLTCAALPGMIARGHGAIINVASAAAFFTVPDTFATYAATKAFVTTFTRGVHEEVRACGVRVQALCPGYTRSELFESAGASDGMPPDATMPAEALVGASLAGLQRGEVVCVPSLDDLALLTKLTEIQDAIVARTMSSGMPAERYRAHETDLQ